MSSNINGNLEKEKNRSDVEATLINKAHMHVYTAALNGWKTSTAREQKFK